MKKPTIRIEELRFTRKDSDKTAALDFRSPFTFVYGASNTGKSFAVKAIDFMLGGSREFPDIIERKPYSGVELDLRLPDDRIAHLYRGIGGADYRLKIAAEAQRTLSARHSKDSVDNLSNFWASPDKWLPVINRARKSRSASAISSGSA